MAPRPWYEDCGLPLIIAVQGADLGVFWLGNARFTEIRVCGVVVTNQTRWSGPVDDTRLDILFDGKGLTDR